MTNRIWPVAVAGLLVAACAGGDEAEPAGEPEATEQATEQVVLATPSCQPSDRMPVEDRTSPYDSTSIDVGEGAAKVCYGRPALKGRTMIGGEAVPYDTLWRTGANEPTTIHVNVAATIGGMAVEPGAYSLYTVPHEGEEWTLIVNRSTEQWGHESSYTEEVRAQEVGRAPVPAESLEEPVEQLTIRPMEGGGGVVLEWQNTRVRIPIRPAG